MKNKLITLVLCIVIAGMLGGCMSTSEKEEYKAAGVELLDQGEYAQAINQFQQAVDGSSKKVSKKDRDYFLYLALAQFKNEDFDEAMATYDQMIEAHKKDWEAYYLRGCVHLRLEDIEAAQADFEKAVSYDKKNIALYANIYQSLALAGERELAQPYMDRAEELGGDKPEELQALGNAYLIGQDYSSAISNYMQALENDEDGEYKQDLTMNLIIAYEKSGNYEKAYSNMKTYVKEYPDDEAAAKELIFLESRVDPSLVDKDPIQYGNPDQEDEE